VPMCGRYALYGPAPARAPRSIISQTLPRTRLTEGSIEQVTARWGLVPFFAKDEKTGYKCINARSETVATSPAFRGPYRRKQRCLVPACGGI
jgi:putative SOS response-associated peptidase YedK